MKSRWFVLVMVVAALLAGFSAVTAQDDANCLGLSADDCALVNAGLANFGSISSFTQSYSFSLSISGMGALDPTAPASVDITSTGSGPAAMVDGQIALGLDMEGSINDGATNASGPLAFRLIGDMIYVQTPAGEWVGGKTEDILGEDNPLSSLTGMMGGMGGADTSGSSGDMDMLNRVATQTRLADETVNGKNTAVFAYNLDIGQLMSQPEIGQAFGMVGGLLGGAGSDSGDMDMVAALLPMLAQAITGNVTFTRWVSVDDQMPQRVDLDLQLNLDLGAMMAGMGAGNAGAAQMPELPPITFAVKLTVDISNHNSTAAPTAPEGARIVTAEEFNQIMGGAFAGMGM